MLGHKICFNEEIGIIIPKLSLLTLLICSTAMSNKNHFIMVNVMKVTTCVSVIMIISYLPPRTAFHMDPRLIKKIKELLLV